MNSLLFITSTLKHYQVLNISLPNKWKAAQTGNKTCVNLIGKELKIWVVFFKAHNFCQSPSGFFKPSMMILFTYYYFVHARKSTGCQSSFCFTLIMCFEISSLFHPKFFFFKMSTDSTEIWSMFLSFILCLFYFWTLYSRP